ncbi:P-loop containing nucleoside triphosphate hydrolase protein [Mycena sp. CBHHK59/15]|nr:P-loop containing nucleoside triphosphate hydrolase protein [Mycena sp. CBHHK59/15]
MDSLVLSTLSCLSNTQNVALKKGNLQTVADLLLTSPQDISRKCRISPLEAKCILDAVCTSNAPHFSSLAVAVDQDLEEICTTGDRYLDVALGGGLRTGMVWEIFGESAAGKTQMALQLSLLVQIPPSLGGLSGSTCYITITSKLPTSRLLQIVEAHPLLSTDSCGLADINTIKSPTIPVLIHILSNILPALIAQRAADSQCKPVKLVVIDALAELFHSSDKTTTSTLVDRSQNIGEIATVLHALASTHKVAVLVLNEVSDVFDHSHHTEPNASGDLIYNQQSRWFGSANNVSGENKKEASLGLVWANQVNVRIMMSRTGRRRYLQDDESSKRQRVNTSGTSGNSDHSSDQALLIRRMSLIFSPLAPPCSLDYVVAAAGISILPDSDVSSLLMDSELSVDAPISRTPSSQIPPSDVGSAESHDQLDMEHTEEDEWDNYWNADDVHEQIYSNVDLGA